MFGIGGMELFIILVVALIVLGPGKLPGVARMLGKAMGELQRATSDLKREIDISAQKNSNSPTDTDNFNKSSESQTEEKTEDKKEV